MCFLMRRRLGGVVVTLWIVLVLFNFMAAFILLYPFYLRDNRPSGYKGIWRYIGSYIRDRYGSVWLLIIIGGGTLFMITSNYIQEPAFHIILVVVYLIFSSLLLLYPYHLKYCFPERYVGFWRNLGEWMGEPLVDLPRRKY